MRGTQVPAGVLHEAFAQDAFEVVYQPVLDLMTRTLSAVTALPLSIHPALAPLSPGDLLQLTEGSSIARGIERLLLLETVELLAGWSADDVPRAAVAFSDHTFRSGEVTDLVLSAAWTRGVALDRIQVEISEHALGSLDAAALADLTALRGLGSSIVVQDFGAGDMTVSDVCRSPADTVKIDWRLAAALDVDWDAPDGQPARYPGDERGRALTVIADGITTAQQLLAVRRLGCQYAQGPYLGPPCAAEDLREYTLRYWRERDE